MSEFVDDTEPVELSGGARAVLAEIERLGNYLDNGCSTGECYKEIKELEAAGYEFNVVYPSGVCAVYTLTKVPT